MTTEVNIKDLSVRALQREAARVLSAGEGYGNHDLAKFNKLAYHDSHAWYRAVIEWYVSEHGDLPSRAGPGAAVKLLYEGE